MAHNRKGMWTAMLALILGLGAFVAAGFFLAPRGAVSGLALTAVGTVSYGSGGPT